MKKTREEKGMSPLIFVIIIVTLIILGYLIVSLMLNSGESEQKVLAWSQNLTTVYNNNLILEVGDMVTLRTKEEEKGEQYSVGNYNGNWVVLGAENGKLLLTSATEVATNVDMYGKNGKTEGVPIDAGYNNGIEKLNNICASYADTKYSEGARSINAEDLKRIIGYEPLRKTTYTYTKEFELPNGKKASEEKPITLTELNYACIVNGGGFENTKAYKSLFKNANYWCASQCCDTYENGAIFGFPVVTDNIGILRYDLFNSFGEEKLRFSGVRAVVTIKQNVLVEKVN